MSNLERKIKGSLAIARRNLTVAFARELSELTGETPSCLYQWGEDLGLPVPRARQTFYSHLASDPPPGNGKWQRGSDATSTEDCRMGSYPMSCQLRLRVVSLDTQFSRDLKSRRQVIVLMGYETCSHLIHFRVYRGLDFECKDDKDTHGIPLCNRLPVATVAAFVERMGKMVGLPLKRVLLTQDLVEVPLISTEKVALLSLSLGRLTLRKKNEAVADNEVLLSFGQKAQKDVAPYETVAGAHPFIEWCGTTTATALTADLSELVNRHNKQHALPRLRTARRAFERLLQKSHDAAVQAKGGSSWSRKISSPFLEQMQKHDYALNDLSLHDVRYCKRRYINFLSFPGDCSSVAELPNRPEPLATRRHDET